MGRRRCTPATRSALARGLALAVTVAACGDVGEPDLGVAPAGPGIGARSAVEAASEEPAPGQAGGASFAAQLTPSRPAGFTPEVLLADAGGVRVVDGPVLLPGLVVDRVLDDPTGGLVVEVPIAEGRRIDWHPAAAGGGQVVSEGDDRLMDVAFIDGSVQAVVADAERVALLRLGEPEEQLVVTVAPDTEVTSASAAGGLYAVVLEDSACGALQLLGADGVVVPVGGVPPAPCQTPGRAAYGLVAFSPDGDTFGYTERSFRSDGVVAVTELVVRDLAGTELHRVAVGGEGQAVLSLALDGDLAMVLREGAPAAELVRLDLAPPEVTMTLHVVEGARSAAFTRVPRPQP